MQHKFTTLFVTLALIGFQNGTHAQTAATKDSSQRWNLHFQQTIVTQHHAGFNALYSGINSIQRSEDPQTSLTSTLYLGLRTWKGGAIYFNPEVAGGAGFSSARGVAGFPNGETFRVGNPSPSVYVARIYMQQTFALGSEYTQVADDANQLKGMQPKHYLTFTFGKICLSDFFDGNSYSHDPRTQFLNWSLMSNGGWDYPANVRGYTWGFVAEYGTPKYVLRLASTMVGDEANGPYMDLKIDKARSETIELEKPYTIKGKPGKLRALAFYTQANMGEYEAATNNPIYNHDITQTRSIGRTKYGVGLNVEQELTNSLGFFARASWNDGKNETWAFTEIDQSISAGLSCQGKNWKRAEDVAGLAFVANGISVPHRNYLAAGGYGFIIGDGRLNYATEMITEAYYSCKVYRNTWFSPGYQFIVNPAYNTDRGPVHVFGLRAHVEF